jgi:exodeoxyribonuclease VII large subunit
LNNNYEQKYIKISDLNNYIKALFDQNSHLRKVYLKGEISNFKNHTRGHLYFTLKDDASRISAVMFYNNALSLNFTPEDGMNVLVEGRISCYPAQGTYQIYVDKMEKDGIGNLYIEYEKLKKKLASEGLFDPKYKKPIPKYPKRIGIITASTGAAIRDILSTIKRRYPICETILFPSLVQGASAAPEIVKQIKKANEYDLDVIICGRGGGSIEDLWAFNEEIVARAIFESQIPIISAVGHEVDFTIADFVADLRAPTPTGAAEMAVPTKSDIINLLTEKKLRLNSLITNKIKREEEKFSGLKNSYVLKNPMMLYEVKSQKLDGLLEQIIKNINNKINENKNKLNLIEQSYILKNPLAVYELRRNELDNYKLKLETEIKTIIKNKDHQAKLLINTLKLVNPLNILEKGYSLVMKDEVLINDSDKIKIDDKIKIKLYKGEITAIVKEKK